MQKKILVVEDSRVLAWAYSVPLRKRGFQVEVATDGKQALVLLRSFEPDAVLLDLMLPKVRGAVILEAIRSSSATRDLPVIVFTSALLRPEEEAQIRQLADGFFHKAQTSPDQVAGLLSRLLSEVDSRAPAQAAENRPGPPAMELAPSPAPEVPMPPAAERGPAPSESVAEEPSLPAALDASAPEPSPESGASTSSAAETKPEASSALANDTAGLLQDLESHTRRLLSEQNDDERSALLTKLAGRLRGIEPTIPMGGSGALGRLRKVFQDLVEDLLQNAKHRSSSAVRTLWQAWPVLGQLVKLAQTTSRAWEPEIAKTLVVDDSVVSLKAVRNALDGIQLNCQTVANPIEAIELCRANPFDLIILDVDMPLMTGPEVCQQLRAIPRHAKTPVIFLTSLNRLDVRVSTARSGGDDFVLKPFLASELGLKSLVHIFRRRLDVPKT